MTGIFNLNKDEQWGFFGHICTCEEDMDSTLRYTKDKEFERGGAPWLYGSEQEAGR